MCSCFQVTVLTLTTPRKAQQGVPPPECWTPSPPRRGYLYSPVQRHSDHITAGGLGELATMLLCPPCFLERARKPCAPPSPARVHVQAQVRRAQWLLCKERLEY